MVEPNHVIRWSILEDKHPALHLQHHLLGQLHAPMVRYAKGKHPALHPSYHWFTSAARPSDDGTWEPHISTLQVTVHPKLICKAVPGAACEWIFVICRLYSADNLD
jgi:hypothetical protein